MTLRWRLIGFREPTIETACSTSRDEISRESNSEFCFSHVKKAAIKRARTKTQRPVERAQYESDFYWSNVIEFQPKVRGFLTIVFRIIKTVVWPRLAQCQLLRRTGNKKPAVFAFPLVQKISTTTVVIRMACPQFEP